MDVHTPQQRSFNMSRIKSKNTKPEQAVRKWLWSQGFRYRLHRKDLPGKPDIVFPSRNKIIFIHGCFWHHHDCRYFKWPKSRTEFWTEKITKNEERDLKHQIQLEQLGWEVLTVWECEIKDNWDALTDSILSFLRRPADSAAAESPCHYGP